MIQPHENFKLRTASDTSFLTPHRWVNDEEGNVCPVLHGRFQLADNEEPIDAYAKWMPLDTHEGQIDCINEISGWLLGKAAGLPMAPQAFLASLPVDRLPKSKTVPLNAKPGDQWFFFCTEEVTRSQAKGILLNEELAAEQSKWEHCIETIAFDEWTGNPDRHLNNLVRRQKNDFVLIDHGRLLRRHNIGPSWTASELPSLVNYPLNNLLHYHTYTFQSITQPAALHEGYLKCTQSVAEQSNLMRRALHEISYWCSLIAPGHSADWLHFLHHRVLYADTLLKLRFGQLPF